MSEYQTVITTLSGGIFTITLNRPEVYNAFNEQLTSDLLECLQRSREE